MIAGLLALTVIAVSAAGIAVRAAADASRQAANASGQHAIALSRELAAESLAADSASPLTARRLAVAAWRVSPTGQAGSVLASLLIEQQQRGILPGDPSNGGVNTVAFSPDSHLLAAAYGDGYVRLWNPVTGQAAGSPLPADTGLGGGRVRAGVQPGRQAAGHRRRGRICAAVEPGHRAGRRRFPPGRYRPTWEG